MLKRTPGKWSWIAIPEGGSMKMVTVVREENDDNLTFDFAGEPLTPTVGDLQLVTNAPEMHELLHEVLDELDEALTQEVITAGIYKVARKIVALLQEINVERTKPPANSGHSQKEAQ